jgi:hypothetical protein
MKKQQITPGKKIEPVKNSSYKFVSKIGSDTASIKKKADSLGLSNSKAQDALRKRIESKKLK